MKLTCADPSCERAPMRARDGQRWCMWHPDQPAPQIDLLSGKLRGPDGKPKKDPKPSDVLRPSSADEKADTPGYRTPGRVVVRRPRATAPAPTDGLCPDEHCDRPYRHRGVHAQRRPEPTRPDDGICLTQDCDRPWRHTGSHRPPKAPSTPREPRRTTWSNASSANTGRRGRQPTPFDHADAARRYQDGEPLFTLAADLHIGAATLRRALIDQGVTLRKRGEVLTPRDSHARPLDVQRCLDLYATGHTSTQIARELGVKTSRVQNALRVAGVLRPPGGRHPGAGAVNSVRLKLGADLSTQVRLRAAALGKPIGHYLRDLVLADLEQARADLEQAS